MTFYSKDKKAVRVYDLLHGFFEEVAWGDEKSDLYYEDGLFVFEKMGIELATSDNFIEEIYEELALHFKPLSEWGRLSGVRPLKILRNEKAQEKDDKQILNSLITRYRLSPKKASLLLEVYRNQEAIYTRDRDKLSLYISIPFCPSICSYCSFHTRPYEKSLAEAYLENLLLDLDYAKELIKTNNRKLDCIYVGGGTPWVLDSSSLTRLFSSLEDFSELKEFTFEGGRLDALDLEKAEMVSKYASRVCINPQSLSPGLTPLLGRPEAENIDYWMNYFRDKKLQISSDLIAGLPGENLASFTRSLERLIKLGPDNITIHNLSLKKGARLKEAGNSHELGSMLDRGYGLLKDAGYKPYYIYRQKNMLGRGENLGYERGKTASIYNIRMMEDAHEILSLGSNAVSKKIIEGEPFRITTARNVSLYTEDKNTRRNLLESFFE